MTEVTSRNEELPVVTSHQDEPLDDFERFCVLSGRRNLVSAGDYGGSMPCLQQPHLVVNKGSMMAGGMLQPNMMTDAGGFLEVPGDPGSHGIRRAKSECGGDRLGMMGPSLDEPPSLSICIKPEKRKPVPLKLWSSICSLVSSSFESPPPCLTPASPGYTILSNSTGAYRSPSTPHSPATTTNTNRHRTRKPRTPLEWDSPSIHARLGLSNPVLATPAPGHSWSGHQGRPVLQRRPHHLSIEELDSLDHSHDHYRVRNFVTTPKGIVNCGDSFRSKSVSSIRSLGSCGSILDDDDSPRAGCSSRGSVTSQCHVPLHRVYLLGAPGTGKTTLAQQFLTSQCMVEVDQDVGE